MPAHKTGTRATVEGYGVIGEPVADPLESQRDMEAVGATDASADCRFRASQKAHLLASAVADRSGTGLV